MFTTRSSNVEVAIRARPLRPEEGSLGWDIESNTLTERQNIDSSFSFDKVYDPSNNTKDIYNNSVKNNIVSHVANGYNATVFAYGQTGSGKTYTMSGLGFDNSDSCGITQLALRDLFELLEKVEKPKGYRIRVFLEMIEIYNENLRDLLVKDSEASATLKIAEGEYGVYVRGAIRRQVSSAEDCLNAMAHEAAQRIVASTNMNHQSSRSHCLIRITVEKVMTVSAAETKKEDEENDESAGSPTSPGADGEDGATGASSSRNMERKVVSSLNLVDLAGSERVSKTGATGQRLIEGGRINQSLSCLTNVIMKMSEPRKPGHAWHIPFRDSKLTHLLKTAIGGNSFTTVFCCMTPSEAQVDESRSTLQFAQRAKKIRNEVQVNEVADPRTRIRTLELEIKKMRRVMVATDLYLWSKELRIKHLMESGGGGAQQQQQANEELTQGLVEENQALRAELQDALEAIAAMGGNVTGGTLQAGGSGGSMHVDPMGNINNNNSNNKADPEEVEDLKNKIFLLESELEEVMGVKGNLQTQVADLEDMLDELEAESQTTQKAKDEQISQLREQVRAYETEKQQIATETESLRSQVEQMTAAREEEQQQLLEKAQGDEAREQLAQLHVKHQALQFEHNTLFEMYSKAEVDKAAKENALQELLQDAETRCAAVKSEVTTIQSYVWKFINLANQVVNGNLNASGEGAENNNTNNNNSTEKDSGSIRQQQVDHAYRVLNDVALRRGGGFAISGGSDEIGGDFSKSFKRTTNQHHHGDDNGTNNSLGGPEALQRRIKELESIITQKDNSRDVIIDTKLKRMQELVMRLHTSNTHMQLEVDRVVAENKRLHELVARDGKLSAIVKSDGLQPASADLIKTAAQFGATPHQPYNHN